MSNTSHRMFFLCWIMGHRRSKSRAYFDPHSGKWRSFCRRCRVTMLRETDGHWHVTDDPGAA